MVGLLEWVLARLGAILGVVLVVTVVAALLAVRRMAGPDGAWGRRLRSRLVMGVPWGTTVVVAGVVGVYLLLQDGLHHWQRPVTIAYRSWGYGYPLGMLAAAFAHSGPGHLVGNVAGTLAFGAVAEYAWGHYPRERGTTTFSSWRTNPWIRALVLFPGLCVALGLATSVFALGPVIGFSGVVFALAGIALVRYPVAALVGVFVSGGLRLGYLALQRPVVAVSPSVSPPTAPWWAEIAIQGHALGLLLGVLVGAGLLARRERRHHVALVWLATLVFAIDRGLWAVYWISGGDTYVLFRGPGLVLVVVLALLVAVAIGASERPLLGSYSRRQVAVAVLLLSTSALAGPAVAANAVTVQEDPPQETVAVRDYTIYYDEDVRNELVASVGDLGPLQTVRTSGVIVTSDRRDVWIRQVRPGELAVNGRASVVVGGPGWREEVLVTRRGWSATGNATTYLVFLHPPEGDRRRAFVADPVRAAPTVAGRNVTVAPNGTGFELVVSTNGSTLARADVPVEGESVSAGGLELRRRGTDVYAVRGETIVRVASKETYDS